MIANVTRTQQRPPLVSVIIPTCNRAALLVEAVRSVIAQTVGDWEVIVVDDGSTDDTVERLERLGEPRLRLLKQSHIGSVARLRNLGAAAAAGAYLAFLDSDDLWVPRKLEVQLTALNGDLDAWCYAGHELVDADGRRMPLRAGRFQPLSGRIARRLIQDETGAAIITWLLPRRIFEESGGFDESLSLREDLDLALRLAERANAIAVPDVLAYTRDHPGRKTKGVADQHLKSAIVFERAAMRASDPELKRAARRRWAGHLASAGEYLVESGNIDGGVALLARALVGGDSVRHCLHAAGAGTWRLLKRQWRG